MISPTISMHDFKKKKKTEDIHTTKTDDCILKTDNRTEIGTSLEVDTDMNTGTAAICMRGASDTIRAMQGELRGAYYSKADTTRNTALTLMEVCLC